MNSCSAPISNADSSHCSTPTVTGWGFVLDFMLRGETRNVCRILSARVAR